MCFFKLALTFLLDFHVYILVEVDAVVGEVVVRSTKIYKTSRFLGSLTVSPTFVHMVLVQTSVIAYVKILTAEIAFFIRLHY